MGGVIQEVAVSLETPMAAVSGARTGEAMEEVTGKLKE